MLFAYPSALPPLAEEARAGRLRMRPRRILVGAGLHLCEDLAIIEAVDADGRPVGPGERSAKIYAAGLPRPLVHISIAESLTRQETGKLKRFVPLPAGSRSRAA